jgi:tetratricopeptide (TPR) repeat protein
MRRIILLFLFLLLAHVSRSLAGNIDSLMKVWENKSLPDSTRLWAVNALAKEYVYEDPDSTEKLARKAVAWAKKINSKKWEINGLNVIGVSYALRGKFIEALDYFKQSLVLSEELQDKLVLSYALGNIGNIYRTLSDYTKALEYQERSLKIKHEINDQEGVALSYNNIGNLFYEMSNYPKALEYHERSLKLQRELKNKRGIALSLNNMGNVLDGMGKRTKAIECYNESLELRIEIGDKSGIISSLLSTGNLNLELNKLEESENDLKKAIDLCVEIDDKASLQDAFSKLASTYLKKKEFAKALAYAKKGNAVADELSSLSNKRNAAKITYQVLKETGNKAEALQWFEQYIEYRDSVDIEKKREDFTRKELKYEYEKKSAADSVKAAEEKKLTMARLEQEKTQRYGLYGGILLLTVFGGFMFNRFKITQKQKHIIQEQKNIVDEKQKEILDSIQYAKRIQQSLLPNENYIDKNLKRMQGPDKK